MASWERDQTAIISYFDFGLSTFLEIQTNFCDETTSQFDNCPSPHLPVSPNNYREITVEWDPNAPIKIVRLEAGGLGVGGICGRSTREHIITIPSSFGNWSLTATKTNVLCTEGITISGVPSGVSYNWIANGAVVTHNWNNGIYISRFTKTGTVRIVAQVLNECHTSLRYIDINVTQPDYGNIQQNGVDVINVLPDCQGNFYLNMPKWVSNNSYYSWELPLLYDDQTNRFTTRIVQGTNVRSIQGALPLNAFTDFVGKVTITGDCGDPVVKTFIVRPALVPSVDNAFFSCSNQVLVTINNPSPSGNINPWVTTTSPSGLWGQWSNFTPTSAVFTASAPGSYDVTIGLTDSRGCYRQLQTEVNAVRSGIISGSGTAGWQSGVLSDNRVFPGSNLVTYDDKIYFTGRDGKLYFYSFNTGIQKWVINTIPSVTTAKLPVGSSFNKISFYTENSQNFILFQNQLNELRKVNLNTFVETDLSPGGSIRPSDFIVDSDKVIYQEGSLLYLYFNQTRQPIGSNSTSLIFKLLNNNDYYFINNKSLFVNSSVLINTGDIEPNSDVFVYNNFIYYVRGAARLGNLYRTNLSTNVTEQITTSGNLSGKFTINRASGVVYYGIQNNPTYNVLRTLSGTFNAADLYQTYVENGVWKIIKTTSGSPEGIDMLIHSPVYVNNHLYYIGAGRSVVTGGSNYGLEVWNLYYESSCQPNVMRQITIVEPDSSVSGNKLEIYPNPAKDQLYFKNTIESENYTISVVDSKGSLVLSSNVETLHSLYIGGLPVGIYTIVVHSNNMHEIRTFVKE
ncbi:MAG: T9SS type A sorting domain-containing protein [Cytophagaceae bacterium]|jgi:hypothetical protein|nr:T9SS type A sorting domain-containing protein [Cytophagaceae bacterium]